jgi:hypothetical protein
MAHAKFAPSSSVNFAVWVMKPGPMALAIKKTAPITQERRDAPRGAVATGGDASIAFTVLIEASLQ